MRHVAGPGDTRLLADAMLGTLVTYLRMCGYDTAYALDRGLEDDEALGTLAHKEGRVLLTRDVALATATLGAELLESREIRDQLEELATRGYKLALDSPTRCGRCNGRLRRLDPDESTPAFAPAADEQPVWICEDCGQPFWKGSHWDDVARTLRDVSEP